MGRDGRDGSRVAREDEGDVLGLLAEVPEGDDAVGRAGGEEVAGGHLSEGEDDFVGGLVGVGRRGGLVREEGRGEGKGERTFMPDSVAVLRSQLRTVWSQPALKAIAESVRSKMARETLPVCPRRTETGVYNVQTQLG